MKRLGPIALTLGALLLLAGLILRFFVIPGLAQFPDDVDETRLYEGQLAVLLNPAALANNDLANLFIRGIPITIDRQVKVLETDGGDALVSDLAVLAGPTGPLESSENYYTIDRKTMEHTDNFANDPRVTDRQGLVVGFPIGTDEKDYLGWNSDTQKTNILSFAGREERGGLDTLHFTASSGPEPIVDPVRLATFPEALPKALLVQLVPALGLPAEAAGQLEAALGVLPDPVPLGYTYSYSTEYWIEPDSGVLVDYAKTEVRAVGLALGETFAPVTEVSNFSYEMSDASAADATSDAKDASRQLFWAGFVLPWGLIIVGAALALYGLVARLIRKPAQ